MRVVRILMIEDNEGDAELIREMLSEQTGDVTFEVQHVNRLSKGVEELARGKFDLILVDLSLPDCFGIETVTHVRLSARSTPMIVLTGSGDRQTGVKAVNAGAQDYLVKGHVTPETLLAAVLRQL